MNVNSTLELVAPAGSPASLDAAIGEGADAVYLGLRDFNARLRAKNFSYNQFDAIVDKLHDLGKKVYVTINTVFEEWEKDRIYPLLKYNIRKVHIWQNFVHKQLYHHQVGNHLF